MKARLEKNQRMRIQPELEQLIKATCNSPHLSSALSLIDERKALEVENYLRAAAIRLDLDEPCVAPHAGL